ncbi:MAG: 2,3-bisphosphoglycerate-independent phosphoglycerate mutase [Bacteroidetes bacterium QS_8_68_15]|nr:MAG: 2,3-bisphosphoglycerate-independent phosphoglycerate mutase [Bacteroidetes bacterium QS_8_68_15]
MDRHALIILDGYGLADDASVSAVDAAEQPFLDDLFDTCPHGTLEASGEAVGLPEGQMGNSEVGHLNLGAGRIVPQEIARISHAIEDESFFDNEALAGAARHTKENGSTLHLMGLFSDGGVHSHITHLFGLLELARRNGLSPEQVQVHAFTDGRDTDPHAGVDYARRFRERAAEVGVGRIASIVGRYWAMDRDERWDRTERAYRLLTEGTGETFADPVDALEASYDDDVTDEFVEPRAIAGDQPVADTRVTDGDAAVFFNFRADRARQLTRAFTQEGFDGFERESLSDFYFATVSPYDKGFTGVPVAFDKLDLKQTMGEAVAERGGTQLRIAETEKYAHVTYFFNGGREEPFDGERREIIDSPKVATYDEQPEMNAPTVADTAAEIIAEDGPNFVCLNFANPDMVGHTGDFDAAVQAVEAVDAAARVVIEAARESGYGVTVIADHGNADKLRNPDGSPHTAHTTALVPHVVIHDDVTEPPAHGKLGDVCPTILALMGEEIPEAMTGEVLVA